MLSDPISDAISRIKNSYLARKKKVEIAYSKINERIIKILEKEKFIDKYKILSPKSKERKTIEVVLKYKNKEPALTEIKRKSKPGLRLYLGWRQIPRVLGGLGTVILSTSRGLLTGQEARKKKIGGEVICEVW